MQYFIQMLILFLMFLTFLIILIAKRKTAKRLVRDLGLAKHILVTWFFVPFFMAYFWFLKRVIKKVRVRVNSPIQWDEPVLVVVTNHPFRKTQDTFLLPITIFSLRPANYLNPIRFFPMSTADEDNFVRSPFFRFVGNGSLIPVKRNSNHNGGRSRGDISSIEMAKERLKEYGGIVIVYAESGRTQTAVRKGRFTTRQTEDGRELVLGRLNLGAAKLAIEMNAPIAFIWMSSSGDDSYPKISPRIVLQGLAEFLYRRKTAAGINIGHPNGVIRPMPGERAWQLTRRIEQHLFETGESV